MFVTYSNYEEVIVCTNETEKETLKVWFEGGDRNLEEYDREEVADEAVCVTARLFTK